MGNESYANIWQRWTSDTILSTSNNDRTEWIFSEQIRESEGDSGLKQPLGQETKEIHTQGSHISLHIKRNGCKHYYNKSPKNKPGKYFKSNKSKQYSIGVVCQLWNSSGHTVKECPFQKQEFHKHQSPQHVIGDCSDVLTHIKCQNGNTIFDAVLDCGATINCVNKDIVKF